MRSCDPAGMALVTVLLLLSAMLVMALTMQLLALFGALTVRNQLSAAQAEAALASLLTHSVLLLEEQLQPGPLLPTAPLLPQHVSYERLSDSEARLALSSSQPQQLATEVLLQLQGNRIELTAMR